MTGRARNASDSVRTAGYLVALLVLAAAITSVVLAVASHTSAQSAPAGSRDRYGAVAPPVEAELNEFTVHVSQFASAPSGDVTFVVKNAGAIDHEMIVLKTSTPFDKLPIVDSGDPPAPVKAHADKVDEAANVGETGDPELKPGVIRTFTIKHLAPGHYALICNLATHYGLGMRTAFTVTAPG